MTWSDDDISSQSLTSVGEGLTDLIGMDMSTSMSMSMDEKEEYVPDSLKAFFAEADAALEECLSAENACKNIMSSNINTTSNKTGTGNDNGNDSRTNNGSTKTNSTRSSTRTRSIGKNREKKKTKTYISPAPTLQTEISFTTASITSTSLHTSPTSNITHENIEQILVSSEKELFRGVTSNNNNNNNKYSEKEMMMDSISPQSDIHGGPYDTDIGSACRTNPANLYVTVSEVKAVALNDDPNACPDHDDGCDCTLSLFTRNNRRNNNDKRKKNDNTVRKLDDLLAEVCVPIEELEEKQQEQQMEEVKEQMEKEEDTITDDENSFLPNNEEKEKKTSTTVVLNSPPLNYRNNNSSPPNDIPFRSTGGASTGSFAKPTDVHHFVPMPSLKSDLDVVITNAINAMPHFDNQTPLDDVDDNDDDDNNGMSCDEDFFPAGILIRTPTITTEDVNKNVTKDKDVVVDVSAQAAVKKKTLSKKASSRTSTRTSSSSFKVSTAAAPTISVKAKSSASNQKKVLTVAERKKIARRRKSTVPKGPTLRTQKLHGDRKYSANGANGITTNTATTTSSNTINDNKKEGVKMNWSQRALTVPESPKFASKERLGNRRYSAVSLRERVEKKDETTMTNSDAAVVTIAAEAPGVTVASVVQVAVADKKISKRRVSTIPKGPKLKTQKLRGERKYSAVGSREEKKDEIMTDSNPTTAAVAVTSKRRVSTIPKGPNLKTQELRGDRKYSAVGAREEKKEKEIEDVQPVIDWKNKALTVPQAPKLASSEKWGDRRYSTVGIREEKVKDEIMTDSDPAAGKQNFKRRVSTIPKGPNLKTQELHGDRKYSGVGFREEKEPEEVQPVVDWKNKALTVPHAPKLVSSEKRGDRRYSAVGVREEKIQEVEMSIKLDWINRKVTKANSPILTTANRPKRENKSDDKENRDIRSFKAAPIMRGVLEKSTSRYGVPKIVKKALTTPKPFHLRSDERCQKAAENDRFESQHAPSFVFHARPLPDFSRNQSMRQSKKAVTIPMPFNLRTSDKSSSPRRMRISMASETIQNQQLLSPTQVCKKRSFTVPKPSSPTLLSPTKKRRVTVPRPFHLSASASRAPSLPIPPPRTASQRVADRKSLLSNSKRTVTKPKPFRLSVVTKSEGPKTEGSPEGTTTSFKARPMPVYNAPKKTTRTKKSITTPKAFKLKTEERASMKPQSDTSPEDLKKKVSEFNPNDKDSDDDCPVNFRRKLLLRQRANKNEEREGKTQSVMDKLEELSALVQQVVV